MRLGLEPRPAHGCPAPYNWPDVAKQSSPCWEELPVALEVTLLRRRQIRVVGVDGGNHEVHILGHPPEGEAAFLLGHCCLGSRGMELEHWVG